MPQFIGGDLISITVNHPTLGNFSFSTKSNESYNLDPGGFRSNDDGSSVAGDGTFIDQINRMRWSVDGVFMVDFVTGQEIDNLPLLSESTELGTWTFSHISGVVWRGRGKFVGDISVDSNTAQLSGKVAGGGRLEKL